MKFFTLIAGLIDSAFGKNPTPKGRASRPQGIAHFFGNAGTVHTKSDAGSSSPGHGHFGNVVTRHLKSSDRT